MIAFVIKKSPLGFIIKLSLEKIPHFAELKGVKRLNNASQFVKKGKMIKKI
jgi:hypothetical protein